MFKNAYHIFIIETDYTINSRTVSLKVHQMPYQSIYQCLF